jgi:L-fuculose-phosphate aldolase
MSENTQDSFMNQSEASINEGINLDLKKHASRENFTLAEMMLIATRKLAEEGHSPYLAGQVTVREEEQDTFWSTDLMKNFAEVDYENLIRFDRQMKIIEGRGMANPAVRFHLWIYEKRADIKAIVHTHPPYASALSTLEQELVVSHMDTMAVYGNCAFVADWPGVPVGNSEGELIANALGETNTCALLGHHGILTTGKTLAEALYLAIILEHAAQMQMIASSAGPIKPIDKKLAEQARDFMLMDAVVNATVDAWGRLLFNNKPDMHRVAKKK